jgi:hypothetical protein
MLQKQKRSVAERRQSAPHERVTVLATCEFIDRFPLGMHVANGQVREQILLIVNHLSKEIGLMKFLNKAVLIAVTWFGVAAVGFAADSGTSTDAGASGSTDAAATFKQLDADGNGLVDSNEAASVQGLDFATADSDRDGSLNQMEFEAAAGASAGAGTGTGGADTGGTTEGGTSTEGTSGTDSGTSTEGTTGGDTSTGGDTGTGGAGTGGDTGTDSGSTGSQ